MNNELNKADIMAGVASKLPDTGKEVTDIKAETVELTKFEDEVVGLIDELNSEKPIDKFIEKDADLIKFLGAVQKVEPRMWSVHVFKNLPEESRPVPSRIEVERGLSTFIVESLEKESWQAINVPNFGKIEKNYAKLIDTEMFEVVRDSSDGGALVPTKVFADAVFKTVLNIYEHGDNKENLLGKV